ncbi:Rad21-Rec8-N domain-containing protein [Fusarium falciforme]|uniref:Rad21-Rec8-N domain-containing protein n=1 Tax=Fusarium falciforme TaxID=195108 RepID=UPI0023012AE6|nr:Rad21-Rec8-N domain-containing protein [Fusarium falciforme]WAO86767.1 Rad21-Rec8-N domain-containing protein [Fusarium falciforme]
MFYSHEILSNTQYGVATIWLVATVGNTNQKKVTRKAIQEVDVPKACETIIHPGAPLALRLQGNLLYGVSCVFAQQCRYVLSDAEKTQADMMTFFRVMQTNETDPRAGKTKRHNITLQDDPNFDPSNSVPNPDLLTSANDLVLFSNKFSSQHNVSQMTPLTQVTGSSGRNHSLLGFDLPQSSHSGGSYRLPTDLNQDSPFAKPFNPQDPLADFSPFGGDELEGLPGVFLNFDADGNLVGLGEPEPELPPLPGFDLQPQDNIAGPGPEKEQVGGENVVIMGEDVLPDAEPFPKRRRAEKSTSSVVPTTESVETEQAQAPARRRRRRKLCRMVDQRDYVPSAEVRSWSVNYLANMEASRKPIPTTTVTQARKNAKALLFGNGIAGVGRTLAGFNHPLVEDFSGISLLARLQGNEPEQEEEPKTRGRRRVSAEAFEENQGDERRVRQKTDDGAEMGRGLGDGMGAIIPGDDMAPEMGMEVVQALEDRHSSSMAPWSRPPSVAPGSSIRGHGSVQKNIPAPSPLLGRGSAVRSIERWSDLPGLPYGSDDFPQLHSQHDTIGHDGFLDGLDFPAGNDTQNTTQGLDNSALDFLGYATVQAQAKGYTRSRDRVDRRWINFDTLTDELEDPASARKFISEAFMHVLTLATKSALAVEQDGIAENQPFGTIRIGLTLPEQDDDMVDELA